MLLPVLAGAENIREATFSRIIASTGMNVPAVGKASNGLILHPAFIYEENMDAAHLSAATAPAGFGTERGLSRR